MLKDKSILLIEDDEVDCLALERAFKELKIKNRLRIVQNGEEAMAYLNEHMEELPGLVLLDLNMPKMNGLEFLGVLKQTEKLKLIPIIILTTSRQSSDLQGCFELGVAGYFVKKPDFKEFVKAVRVIHDYWTQNELPV